MRQRKPLSRPEYVYPVHEWKLIERRFYPRLLPQYETFFCVSNGYLGMRGNFEEGTPVYDPGTYVNGFYESWPIVYGEDAFGFARNGQTMVNVTDGKIIKLYVDDEPLYLPTATLAFYERTLDMQAGKLDRELVWETQTGKLVRVRSTRFISFEQRHLAVMRYEVTVQNADANVVVVSELAHQAPESVDGSDPRRPWRFQHESVLETYVRDVRDQRVVLGQSTQRSRMTLGCGMDHVLQTNCSVRLEARAESGEGMVTYRAAARAGEPIEITKFVAYHSSRRAEPQELALRVQRTLDRAVEEGFDKAVTDQRRRVDDFWQCSDVQVFGDPPAQQALRFNLFQILQATGRAEGVGVPAKGLTGPGYEGHYFWDSEIYVLPFLIYTAPRIARNLLKFRWSGLDKARERARQVNQKGALFPWRTINGEEASAYYAAGTAQYHINADIAYAIKKYVDATGDRDFLWDYGAEILVETARLWADLGFFTRDPEPCFNIHGVTGPDEYNTVVDNNTYTNLMARENLWYAARTVTEMHETHPERFAALLDRTAVEMEEVAEWQRAADCMYVPYDEATGIHPQDDSFLEKERWDFENTPDDKYPLLLHHHPLVIYRHQVLKQADVVLAIFLLGDHFTREAKKRNFEFYDPLTTGDSSLSTSIQAIVAADVGDRKRATEYARYALLMDLGDICGNVTHGCHIASMGGTWMVAAYGVAGFRDYDGVFEFQPRAPRLFDGLKFPVCLHGQWLEVEVRNEYVVYTLRKGEGLEIRHGKETLQLTPGTPIQRALRAPTEPDPPA